MTVETLNSIFEGIISVLVIGGAGLMIAYHPDNTAITAIASGGASAVIVFWFGQRGTTKAINSNITAMSDIAGQVKSAPGPAGPPGPAGEQGPPGVQGPTGR